FLAFQVSGVTHRTDIDQGTWQERTDAVNVDSEAALNLTVDNALDHFLSGESCFQNDPALGTLGFLAGQLGLTEAIFNRVQRNVNFVTHADGQLALLVVELLDRDDALGLQTGMDGDPVTIDVDHDAGDDGARLHVEGFQAFFKKFCKAFAHVYSCCFRARIRPISTPQITWVHSYKKRPAGLDLVSHMPPCWQPRGLLGASRRPLIRRDRARRPRSESVLAPARWTTPWNPAVWHRLPASAAPPRVGYRAHRAPVSHREDSRD